MVAPPYEIEVLAFNRKLNDLIATAQTEPDVVSELIFELTGTKQSRMEVCRQTIAN